jgi:hypothetical protein
LSWTDAEFSLPGVGVIAIHAADVHLLRFSALQLQAALAEFAHLDYALQAGGSGVFNLNLVPTGVRHPQGYELTVTREAVHLVASTPQGIFYGVQTLKQLLQLRGRQLPTLRCADWPDFPQRGVMLDISRDKVYKMDTLYDLVEMLTSWKVNQLQLYTEHTFAYRHHRLVWEQASPMTGEEILALDAFCRERFIDLVPNQNSFGHMRRWLIHEPYRPLAEAPEGCDTVWGHFDEPFTLYPGDPASFALVQSLFDELLPHFSSRQFNVGCDETVDLGEGRSKKLAKKIGVGRVYLDFVLKIYHDLQRRDRTMQYWGDVIMHHPELVPELPRDAIALEWGYEADHPFDQHGELFAASGIPFYVCPGTSSWNTVAGRTQNALGNLINAAENGLKHGAVGYLNTDWGDNGHWQPLPVSYLGFAYGAAVSWGLAANRAVPLAEALSRYAFRDQANCMGRLAFDLGDVHLQTGIETPNSTVLFRILQANPADLAMYQHQAAEITARMEATLAAIDTILAPLGEAQMQRSDADLLRREFTWAAEMLHHACRRAIWALGVAGGQEDVGLRRRLLGDADLLITAYDHIWHARNRPGGFRDSVARLEKMRNDYR